MHMTDEEIQAAIDEWERLNESRRQVIASTQADIDRYMAELERRGIEAFWQANPGERLEVGDGLLVTEEYKNWYLQQDTTNTFLARSGRSYVITGLRDDDGGLKIDCEGLWFGYVAIDIARRMRQAWLEQQAKMGGASE